MVVAEYLEVYGTGTYFLWGVEIFWEFKLLYCCIDIYWEMIHKAQNADIPSKMRFFSRLLLDPDVL